jgi:hypothetical protein
VVFVAAALAAARTLRFAPAVEGGAPVAATVPVRFRFEPPAELPPPPPTPSRKSSSSKPTGTRPPGRRTPSAP